MLDEVCSLLKEYNIRATPQRKAILQILYDCKGHHLERENIYRLLAATGGEGGKIGLATVYRTIELFERVGLVSKLSMEDAPAKYELVMPEKQNHNHLICLKCGRVQEIDDCYTEDLKRKVLRDKGFAASNKTIKIYGYCSDCRDKNNSFAY